MKKALITGILGQDGSFMAELLNSKGYEVHGILKTFTDKDRILWIRNLIPNIKLYDIDLINEKECFGLIDKIRPNEIYNFAAVSNVFNPFENLNEVYQFNSQIPCNILTSIIKIDKSIKFFQASSCLIYGKSNTTTQNEETLTKPINPYGVAKLYTDNMISEFRDNYGIFACSGIFFNHESERRGNLFFTKKIINNILDIVEGKIDKISVGDVSTSRDMGYAPEFMEAVYLMMQNSEPKDYVIGTGKLTKLSDFVSKAFSEFNLNWEDYIEYDKSLFREIDTPPLLADITNIKNDLGWEPKYGVDDIIKKMIKIKNERII
tara:strand:- start:1296 stop:2255 length:960 start_codon:yes stop_codon:yes gene_type:complete